MTDLVEKGLSIKALHCDYTDKGFNIDRRYWVDISPKYIKTKIKRGPGKGRIKYRVTNEI